MNDMTHKEFILQTYSLRWSNVIKCRRPGMHISEFFEHVNELGYPYFLFNGKVYVVHWNEEEKQRIYSETIYGEDDVV